MCACLYICVGRDSVPLPVCLYIPLIIAVSLFKLFEPLITEHSLQYLNDEEGEVRHKEYRACFQDSSLKSFYGIFNDVSEV